MVTAVKRSAGRSPRRASSIRRRRHVATTAAMGRGMMRSPPSRLKVRRRHVSGTVPQTSITQAAASALVRAKRARALPQRTINSIDALRRLSSVRFFQYVAHFLSIDSYNDPTMERKEDVFKMAQLRNFSQVKSFAHSNFGDPYISHSQECTPLALQQYLEVCRRMFMDHFYLMRTPAYERDLRVRLRREQLRNQELKNRSKLLEDSISTYREQGGALLHAYSNKVAFGSEIQSRKLIKYHNSLKDKTKNLRKEVQELSRANQSLVKSYKTIAHNLKESLCSGAVAPSSKTQEALDALHKSLRCEAGLLDTRSKDLIQLSPELAHYRPGTNSEVTSPRMKSLLKKTLLAVGVPPELSPLKKPKEMVPAPSDKKRKVPAPLNIVPEKESEKQPEVYSPEFCAPKPPNLELRRASEPPQPSQAMLNRRKLVPTTPQSQTVKQNAVLEGYPTLFSVLDSSAKGKSHVFGGRSMHASLQDLISEEFSRPSTASPSQQPLSHEATPTLTMTSGLGSSISGTAANSASNSKDISNINDLVRLLSL
ncbi:Histone-lysine N-methyltransferase, H3 lysine-79 specific [Cichlidogyrus casuarinus]|uniref:Histone-lysine N-methyltransferase, H3 lysine-79 specific n=1 Tax=Cichlidogyrus casuarinus TaxID=1844966 RepID=A0ABD2PWL6_9PLAT